MCTPRERIVNAFSWCFSGIFLIILLNALGNDIGAELQWPLMAHCLLDAKLKSMSVLKLPWYTLKIKYSCQRYDSVI